MKKMENKKAAGNAAKAYNGAAMAAEPAVKGAAGMDTEAGDDRIRQLEEDLSASLNMLYELIFMHQKESELKKKHKAYLHVREGMDRMCEKDLEMIGEILGHFNSRPDLGSTAEEEVGISYAAADGGRIEPDAEGSTGYGSTAPYKGGMMLVPTETISSMMDDILLMAESRSRLSDFLSHIISGNPFHRADVYALLALEEEVDEQVYPHMDRAWVPEDQA